MNSEHMQGYLIRKSVGGIFNPSPNNSDVPFNAGAAYVSDCQSHISSNDIYVCKKLVVRLRELYLLYMESRPMPSLA
jgi:hypothetical protein